MQLSDAGNQVVSRPAPNPTVAPGWVNNNPGGPGAATISDPDMANAILAELKTPLDLLGVALSKASINQTSSALAVLRHGGCALSTTGSTNVTLLPANGCGLVIAGALFAVPAAGISATTTSCFVNGVAAQALAASTFYYVYAFNNSGTLTLDFSTTAHATDSTAGNQGVEIKSGDNSRTLVGALRTDASAHVVNTASSRLLASWFNRANRDSTATALGTTNTSSTTPVELNAANRALFLSWAGEATLLVMTGQSSNSTAGDGAVIIIAVDGTAIGNNVATGSAVANTTVAQGCQACVTLAEGFHQAEMFGSVATGGGTANFNNLQVALLTRI